MKLHIILIITILSIISHSVGAQIHRKDTISVDSVSYRMSSPAKATLLSAVIPGLGQVYNKKYWKLPLIYAGIGSFIYRVVDFNNKYKYYRNAYAATKYCVGPSDFYNDVRYSNLSRESRANLFEKYKTKCRRARDLNAILLVGFYIINIVDASVDAHFTEFDVSDKLTIDFEPVIQSDSFGQSSLNYISLGCVIKF